MSTFSSRCSDFVSDLVSYHKRFSSFQKIVIILIIVGVLSTVSYKFLTVGVTFICALLGSFKLSQYVVETQNTVTFTEKLWIYSRKYGFVFRYLGTCRLGLLQWWHDYNDEQKATSLAQTGVPNKHQNEVFQDPIEDPDKFEETDLQNGGTFNLSNNVVPQHSPPKCIVDKKSHPLDELELFISLISRDFIYDWYQIFSSDPGVLENVDDVLHKMVALVCNRLSKVDRYLLLRDVLLHYRDHLYKFQTARSVYKTQPRRASLRRKSSSSSSDIVSLVTNLNVDKRIGSIEEAFGLKFKYHKALLSKENEINYLRGCVQILLKKLVQSEIRDSKTPQHALDEIFTCNIFYPLLELFSGSDFLHECIIMLLSDEEFDYITDVDDGEMLELPNSINKPLIQDQEDLKLQESEEDVFHDLNEETLGERTSSKSDDSDNSDSISHDMGKNMSPLCNINENVEETSHTELIPGVRVTEYDGCNLKSSELVDVPVQNTTPDCQIKDVLGSGENIEKEGPNSLQGIQNNKLFFIDSGDYDNVEIENEKLLTETEELYEGNTKTFTTVSIPDTEIAKEPRSSTQYTLYNIQYNAMYFDESECGVVRTKTVKRRHREFINLQSRLEDNKLYSKILKDIKGPKRWKLPFGNMDKSSIENRREELEKYLKKLIEALEICEGPELKEFLAYEEDAHISYFVKGASEMSVPRFDQMIVRTVSGVFDKIGELSNRAQEALPSLPGRKSTTLKDKEVKSYPVEDTDQIKLEFCTVKEQVLMVEATIDDYIKQDEKDIDDIMDINPADEEVTVETTTEDCSARPSDGIELTKAIVDLAIQTLQSRDSWICRERVINFSQNLGGRVLNSWLKLEIDDLTTEERCAYYLNLLRETIWPNGKLSTERRAVKTDRQKAVTKTQAKRCLAEFFPDVLQFLVGEEDYNFSLDEIIESLQYEKLNRQFLFGLLDLLVERLFPETRRKECHQEFQG